MVADVGPSSVPWLYFETNYNSPKLILSPHIINDPPPAVASERFTYCASEDPCRRARGAERISVPFELQETHQ